VRVNQRVINQKEERCAVCRDGPDGLVVCRGCNTFLHASCLIDVRGCPTLGCNERDPLEAQQADCCHDTYNAVDRSCADCGMSYKQTERDRKSPQKEPICKHEITAWDQECIFCHRTVADIHDEEFASYTKAVVTNQADGYLSPRIRAKEQWGPAHKALAALTKEVGADAAMASFGITNGEMRASDSEKIRNKKRREIFYMIVMALAFFSGLLHAILTSKGYIPS